MTDLPKGREICSKIAGALVKGEKNDLLPCITGNYLRNSISCQVICQICAQVKHAEEQQSQTKQTLQQWMKDIHITLGLQIPATYIKPNIIRL